MIAPALFTNRVDAATLEAIAVDIAEIERELSRQVGSRIELVDDVCSHTLQAGGKRLRPAFVALAAKACGTPYDATRVVRLGACMEMIHMATLIHDDVIDRADTRRGKATASAVFGNTAAILSGDVLLARAMTILAQDGDLEIIRLVSSAVVELAEGEVRELETRGRIELTEAEHFEILRMKTASFIECCCRVGAKVASAPVEIEDALGCYGHTIGMAFQVVDDLLDYRGDHAKTGKPVATDYVEGCPTLPLIYLWPLLEANERDQVASAFGHQSAVDTVPIVVRWMNERGAFTRAEATADRMGSEAVSALSSLPTSSERDLLEAVADFVINRQA